METPDLGVPRGSDETGVSAPDEAPPEPEPRPPCPAASRPDPAPCPPCAACPACPDEQSICRETIRSLREVQAEAAELQDEVEAFRKRYPRHRYHGALVSDRRRQAAEDGTLLMEFPGAGEGFDPSETALEKLGVTLSPADRKIMEQLYRTYREDTFREMQEIYADLMGDPDAGLDSSLESLMSNILRYGHGPACNEAKQAVLEVLRTGGALQPGPADAHPCALFVLALVSNVDRLEGEVARQVGEDGVSALWGIGKSSFSSSFDAKNGQ